MTGNATKTLPDDLILWGRSYMFSLTEHDETCKNNVYIYPFCFLCYAIKKMSVHICKIPGIKVCTGPKNWIIFSRVDDCPRINLLPHPITGCGTTDAIGSTNQSCKHLWPIATSNGKNRQKNVQYTIAWTNILKVIWYNRTCYTYSLLIICVCFK